MEASFAEIVKEWNRQENENNLNCQNKHKNKADFILLCTSYDDIDAMTECVFASTIKNWFCNSDSKLNLSWT
jgi:hypothetical protein